MRSQVRSAVVAEREPGEDREALSAELEELLKLPEHPEYVDCGRTEEEIGRSLKAIFGARAAIAFFRACGRKLRLVK